MSVRPCWGYHNELAVCWRCSDLMPWWAEARAKAGIEKWVAPVPYRRPVGWPNPMVCPECGASFASRTHRACIDARVERELAGDEMQAARERLRRVGAMA